RPEYPLHPLADQPSQTRGGAGGIRHQHRGTGAGTDNEVNGEVKSVTARRPEKILARPPAENLTPHGLSSVCQILAFPSHPTNKSVVLQSKIDTLSAALIASNYC